MARMIIVARRGSHVAGEESALTQSEERLAWSLQLVWFALLVGWSGGLHTQAAVVDHTRVTAELLLAGGEALQ